MCMRAISLPTFYVCVSLGIAQPDPEPACPSRTHANDSRGCQPGPCSPSAHPGNPSMANSSMQLTTPWLDLPWQGLYSSMNWHSHVQ